MRKSFLALLSLFTILSILLFVLSDTLKSAHIDDSINKVTSDGSVYFNTYQLLYADAELRESPALFLVGSPMLFLKLAEGNLFIVQTFNLVVMWIALYTAIGSLSTFRGRILFITASLCFPYFIFGFLGLNKEVYAMSSAIIFGSYLITGTRRHLFMALALAACARYYMLIALAILFLTLPRNKPPRYILTALLATILSILAPVAKNLIPEYSSSTLTEDYSGTIGNVFFWSIDHYGYALIYPLKYIFLVFTRGYGFLVGASEDAMGAAVSALSIVMIVSIIPLWRKWKTLDDLVKRMLAAGAIAPLPIMWSEIMHWRYYSFVYFFFLYGIILHGEHQQTRKFTPGITTPPPPTT